MERYNEITDGEERLVHERQVARLGCPAMPGPLAGAEADRPGRPQIAGLVQRCCSPRLAPRAAG